jgi:hypothetical protein
MKRRSAGIWFFVLFLLLVQGQLLAGVGPKVIESGSIGTVYLNVGKLYDVIYEHLAAVDSADASVKSQISQMLTTLGKDNPFGKEFSIEDLSSSAVKWHKDAYFIPTGALWVSVSKDLMPRIVIEADFKLDEVTEFLQKYTKNEINYEPKKKLIEFRLPVHNLLVQITPKYATIGKITNKPEEVNNSWKPFLRFASSPNQLFALELDMQSVFEAIAMERRKGEEPHQKLVLATCAYCREQLKCTIWIIC